MLPTRLPLLSLALLFGPAATWFRSIPAPHGYDFPTAAAMESTSSSFAKLLIMPAFQGKTEVALEEYNGLGVEKPLSKI
ncbi:MAG: hypothetical protein ACRYFK_03745 [Janthinobacterium lividum]